MAAFELVSPFQPAGDQPQAIEQLVDGLRHGRSHQTLMGVTGSGKTFTMANVIARMGRPALVMSHNKTLAAQLYSEFKEFFPHNAVRYFVSRNDVIVVASVSCIYGLGSPDDYRKMMVRVQKGTTIDRDEMLLRLVDI